MSRCLLFCQLNSHKRSNSRSVQRFAEAVCCWASCSHACGCSPHSDSEYEEDDEASGSVSDLQRFLLAVGSHKGTRESQLCVSDNLTKGEGVKIHSGYDSRDPRGQLAKSTYHNRETNTYMSIAVGVTAKLSSSIRLVAIRSRSLKKPGHAPAEGMNSVGVGSHWVFGLPRKTDHKRRTVSKE